MDTSENKAPELVAVTIIFVTISILSVLLRLYTRLRILKWIGVDDVFIFVAAGGALVEAIGNLIGTQYGLGGHIEQQLPEWRKPYAITTIASSLGYSLSAMFVKLSLLSFYLRLSREPVFRTLTYILIFIAGSFGISSILAAALQCVPISMLWDPTQPGHCVNITAFYFANAGIHIFTEVLIYALPLHTLWNLHLPFRQKLGLVALITIGAGYGALLYILGISAQYIRLIVVSCYRLVTIRDLLASADSTWNVTTPLIWYTVELNLAIFIACGPAFLAFFRHYLPAVFGGSSSRTKYKATEYKGSFPLGSFQRDMTKSGIRTTVTADGGLMSGTLTGAKMDDNSSEDLIIIGPDADAARDREGLGGGITKQVEVWVDGELLGSEAHVNSSNV